MHRLENTLLKQYEGEKTVPNLCQEYIRREKYNTAQLYVQKL